MSERAINVPFKNEEFQRLMAAKGKTTWHDFIMRLAVPGGVKLPMRYWVYFPVDVIGEADVMDWMEKTLGIRPDRSNYVDFSLQKHTRRRCAEFPDLESAQTVARALAEISGDVDIMTVPICSKCIRFFEEDGFCSTCGSRLTPSKSVVLELEGG